MPDTIVCGNCKYQYHCQGATVDKCRKEKWIFDNPDKIQKGKMLLTLACLAIAYFIWP
jgi:hypothetical protein